MASFDPKLEFNAPQYVDFTQHSDGEDDKIEEYFDIAHETIRIPLCFTEGLHHTPKQKMPSRSVLKDSNSLTPRRSQRILSTKVSLKSQIHNGKEITGCVDENATEDEDNRKSRTAKKKQSPKSKTVQKQNDDAPAHKRLRRCASFSTRSGAKKSPDRAVRSTTTSQNKRHLRSESAHINQSKSITSTKTDVNMATAKKRTRSTSTECSRLTRKHQRSISVDVGRNPSQDTTTNATKWKPQLTKPVTPAVLKRQKSANTDVKTWEERQLEETNRLRKELAEKRKLAMESMKRAQASTGHVQVQSVQQTTQPKEFHFRTDDRVKGSNLEKGSDKTEVDFIASLRSNDVNVCKSVPTATKQQPFNLHENKHKSSTQQKYQSTAEIMKAFTSKTPDRFRTRPRNKEPTPPRKRDRTTEIKLTVAKTPKLETLTRKRPVTAISQAELEEKEIEEIKKYKFCARPVNEKILKNPDLGVQKVEPKELTKPEGFEFETERRLQMRQTNKTDIEEEQYEFHAKPVPNKIFEGPVGVKCPKKLPLTMPASPAFALRERLRAYRHHVKKEEEPSTKLLVNAKPAPYIGVPFQPKLSHKTTEIQPFSFEERTKMMLAKKEEKIKKLLEEEKKMREFHARPLQLEPTPLPEKCPKPVTKPKPFKLKVDEHGSQYAEKWAQKIEEELRQQREMALFKAKPPVSVYKPPFVPKPSNKPSTDVQEFELLTEKRTEKWLELERYRQEREAEQAELQRAMERRRQEEEEAERRRLRREAIHRANPIRNYKPVEVKPSDKPLTVAESPRFSERLRSRTQHKSD